MTDEDIKLLEAERSLGLFKRQEKTIKQAVLNNRGRKWLRDQLALTTVISGVGLLSGFTVETWIGMNILSLPVTVYYANETYKPLSDDLSDDSEQVKDGE